MARASVFSVFAALALIASLLSCSGKADPNTLVMVIESSPTNLDPRVGIDAHSERIDNLIFDYLVVRGPDLNVAPGLAERWEVPDPLTYIFYLHHGVKFHDGRPLTSRDVKWTFDSLLSGKIRSTRAAAYRFVDHIDAPDDFTVIFHMKEADAALLWNLTDGAVGIVPSGSGDEVARHPIGSGPFKFVSAETDKEVVVERNDDYWGEKANLAARTLRGGARRDHSRLLNFVKEAVTSPATRSRPTLCSLWSANHPSPWNKRPGTEVQYMGFQPARSHSEGCAGAPGHRLRPRPAAR